MNQSYKRKSYALQVVMRREAEDRLATTCFRGVEVCCSGNFSRWSDFQAMMDDREISAAILRLLDTAIARIGATTSQSLIYRCSKPVGWASTVPIALAEGWQLEQRKVNSSPSFDATGLFVVEPGIEAPRTRMFTLKYELRKEGNVWVAVIHSAYPGRDVGRLVGDVSGREGRVFFDFEHPGSTTWTCDD